MQLTNRRDADTVTIEVVGEMDATTAYDVYLAAIEAGRQSGCRRVVLDLARVGFLDSTGLSMLIRSRDELAETGCAFALASVGDAATQLLTVTGLHDQFDHTQPPAATVANDTAEPAIEDPDLAAGQFLERPQG